MPGSCCTTPRRDDASRCHRIRCPRTPAAHSRSPAAAVSWPLPGKTACGHGATGVACGTSAATSARCAGGPSPGGVLCKYPSPKLVWHGDGLVAHPDGMCHIIALQRLALRDDGRLALCDRRTYVYPDDFRGVDGTIVAAAHDELYLLTEKQVRAIDLRCRAGPPPVLADWPQPRYYTHAMAVGDGRHIAVTGAPHGERLLLYDVRAATTDAVPAEMREPTTKKKRALCGTAQGTLLVWAQRHCAAHGQHGVVDGRCLECCYVLQEWDPRDGTVRDLLKLRHPSGDARAVCADERRVSILTRFPGDELCVFDATGHPAPPSDEVDDPGSDSDSDDNDRNDDDQNDYDGGDNNRSGGGDDADR